MPRWLVWTAWSVREGERHETRGGHDKQLIRDGFIAQWSIPLKNQRGITWWVQVRVALDMLWLVFHPIAVVCCNKSNTAEIGYL